MKIEQQQLLMKITDVAAIVEVATKSTEKTLLSFGKRNVFHMYAYQSLYVYMCFGIKLNPFSSNVHECMCGSVMLLGWLAGLLLYVNNMPQTMQTNYFYNSLTLNMAFWSFIYMYIH